MLKDNSKLEEVVINSRVQTWGNQAFMNCNNIRRVYNNTPGIPGKLFATTFAENVYNNATLYVPAGSEYYYSKDYWYEKEALNGNDWVTAFLGPWWRFMENGRPINLAFSFAHPNVTFSYSNNLDFAISNVVVLNENGRNVSNDLKMYKIVSNNTDDSGNINTVRAIQVNANNTANCILEPNKGVMLSGNPAYTYYITAYFDSNVGTKTRADLSGNLMVGNGNQPATMLPTEDKRRYFIYTLKKYGEMFYESEPGMLPAYHAYLDLGSSTSSNAKSLSLVFQPQLTNTIENTSRTATDSSCWHNLYGMKMVGKPCSKGIYIKNGKKTVIK